MYLICVRKRMTAMKPLFFYLKCVWVCHVNLNSYNFLVIIGISERFEDIKGVVNRYTGFEICAKGGKAKFPKNKKIKKRTITIWLIVKNIMQINVVILMHASLYWKNTCYMEYILFLLLLLCGVVVNISDVLWV